MKICLMGEFFGDLDEGMRKSSHYYRKKLTERGNEVLAVDLREIKISRFIKDLRTFDPDVIHITHGPTVRGLALLKTVSACCPGAVTVASAMLPDLPPTLKTLMPLLKPDIVLTQSTGSETAFKAMGCTTKFIPAGVDADTFIPASDSEKRELRRKYGVSESKFVVLHVGSVKEGRNVRFLKLLNDDATQVMVVGAASPGLDEELVDELREAGCTVSTDFVPKIEDMYRLSDCYAFPATGYDSARDRPVFCSIEIPLSVMEAMSCNLPVVTTRFGGLSNMFEEGDGLHFIESPGELQAKLEKIRGLNAAVNTRNKVAGFSWDNIAEDLNTIYIGLRAQKRARRTGTGAAGELT